METTANRIEIKKVQARYGLETIIDGAAAVNLFGGMIVATGLFVVALLSVNALTFLASVLVIASSTLLWLLLRWAAEQTRLLKTMAGLHFAGRISGPYEEIVGICSKCRSVLHSDTRCDACGAAIVASNDS